MPKCMDNKDIDLELSFIYKGLEPALWNCTLLFTTCVNLGMSS